MEEVVIDSTDAYQDAVAAGTAGRYVLRLYVTGSTPKSVRAIANLQRICEEYLSESYELEVIDLYLRPSLAAGDQIIAAPTLIKQLPEPFRRVIGDMSDTERVLVGLDLRPTFPPG